MIKVKRLDRGGPDENFVIADINKRERCFRSDRFLRAMPEIIESGMNGQIQIAVKSDKGETGWIDISDDEYRVIEMVLEQAGEREISVLKPDWRGQ